jgi:hypothetical protein
VIWIELTWLAISLFALVVVLRAAWEVGGYQKHIAARYLLACLVGSVVDDLCWTILAIFSALDLNLRLVAFILLTLGRLARVIPMVAFALHLMQARPFWRRSP